MAPSFSYATDFPHDTIFGLSSGNAKLASAYSLLRQADVLTGNRLAHPGIEGLRATLIQLQESHAVLRQRVTGWYFLSSLWYANDAVIVEHVEKCWELYVRASSYANVIADTREQGHKQGPGNARHCGGVPRSTQNVPSDHPAGSRVMNIGGISSTSFGLALNIQCGNESYGPNDASPKAQAISTTYESDDPVNDSLRTNHETMPLVTAITLAAIGRRVPGLHEPVMRWSDSEELHQVLRKDLKKVVKGDIVVKSIQTGILECHTDARCGSQGGKDSVLIHAFTCKLTNPRSTFGCHLRASSDGVPENNLKHYIILLVAALYTAQNPNYWREFQRLEHRHGSKPCTQSPRPKCLIAMHCSIESRASRKYLTSARCFCKLNKESIKQMKQISGLSTQIISMDSHRPIRTALNLAFFKSHEPNREREREFEGMIVKKLGPQLFGHLLP
ncbi:hypothetical protein CONPUDRAFT_71409 [Coniophora puteana RWD-64-598 SS2]|uniref:Uncharacterized protein n=1 Tax=Coniophora puteana (strain RWD-64-598) TaxID=741705 RepID=A0A5M3MVC9_CONPW|nr:uncharacterized protein CONPUDRAFT_71409 [Coniophora puteana RWD-64-598 SS2]EIW82665.1 hypothetical protein CONPUDRAFT_71409 [Coniophora puteana RWD-64-598 SS2]